MTSKREPIRAFEGQPVRVLKDIYDSLADEGERVAEELRLRVGGVTRLAGALRFDNMIGTIATPLGAIEIVPKTFPGQNWLRSVVDLLDDRPVTIADDVPSSDHTTRAPFRNLIAAIYARRLTRALAAEGPITTIEAERHRSAMLGGRLMVEEWVRTVAYSPHTFPIERQTLSTRNSFTRTLASVGQLLAPHVADPALRRRLVEAIDQMADGQDISGPPPDAIDLPLPDQWGGYLPAWTIAQMILKDRSQAGERPRPHGISIAIEPWVLLERLLERSVVQLAKTLNSGTTSYSSKTQMRRMFLSGRLRDAGERFLYPDCVLIRDGIPLVSFEAKYRNYDRTGAPMRSESYQAITAGRALDTEMAVLVYPNGNEPKVLDVLQRGHRPERLATVGLDLFDYRHGRETGIAEKIGRLLGNVTGTDTNAEEGAAA